MILRRLQSIVPILLLAFVLIFSWGCSQQTEAVDSFTEQTAVTNSSFEKMTQLDWEGYSTYVHPDALERFRGTIIPSIEKLVLVSSGDSISFFGQQINSQEIQSMPADSFFAKIMNIVTEISPDIKITFESMQQNTLGAIAESDSLVHVVLRTKLTLGGQDIEELNVQSVKLDGDAWKIDLSSKIGGVAMMISQGIEYQMGNTGR
jgi:hypothetical protein